MTSTASTDENKRLIEAFERERAGLQADNERLAWWASYWCDQVGGIMAALCLCDGQNVDGRIDISDEILPTIEALKIVARHCAANHGGLSS